MQAQRLVRAGPAGAPRPGAAFAPVANPDGNGLRRVFLQLPDLVNGDDTHFQYVFVAPGIPNAYHWVRNMPVLPANADEDQLAAVIISEAAVHSVKLAAQAAAMAADVRRTKCLVMATVRAIVRRTWGVAGADLIANQSFDLVNPPDLDGIIAAGLDPHGDVARLDYDEEAHEIEQVYNGAVDTWLPLVAKLAVGTPIVAGVILVATTNHHFVDPHKPIARATVRQIFGAGVTTVPGLTQDEFEDGLFHKACHPVSSNVLVGIARDGAIRGRIAAVGLASAVVRVPALYPPERAASAFQALARQVAAAGADSNVALDIAPIDAMFAAVSTAITNVVTPTTLVAGATVVEDFVARHGHALAWAAGFLTAVEAETGARAVRSSILRSYAVTRVGNDNAAARAAGAEHYDSAIRWRRARAREGHLAGVGLFGAPTPAAFRNPAEAAAAPAARAAAPPAGP